jgi:hypothetical protein
MTGEWNWFSGRDFHQRLEIRKPLVFRGLKGNGVSLGGLKRIAGGGRSLLRTALRANSRYQGNLQEIFQNRVQCFEESYRHPAEYMRFFFIRCPTPRATEQGIISPVSGN